MPYYLTHGAGRDPFEEPDEDSGPRRPLVYGPPPNQGIRQQHFHVFADADPEHICDLCRENDVALVCDTCNVMVCAECAERGNRG